MAPTCSFLIHYLRFLLEFFPLVALFCIETTIFLRVYYFHNEVVYLKAVMPRQIANSSVFINMIHIATHLVIWYCSKTCLKSLHYNCIFLLFRIDKFIIIDCQLFLLLLHLKYQCVFVPELLKLPKKLPNNPKTVRSSLIRTARTTISRISNKYKPKITNMKRNIRSHDPSFESGSLKLNGEHNKSTNIVIFTISKTSQRSQ